MHSRTRAEIVRCQPAGDHSFHSNALQTYSFFRACASRTLRESPTVNCGKLILSRNGTKPQKDANVRRLTFFMHRLLRTFHRVGTVLLCSTLPTFLVASEPSKSAFGDASAWKKCGDPSCHSKDEFAALLKSKRSSSSAAPAKQRHPTPEDHSKRCPLMREQLGHSTWNLVRFRRGL
jgi:hypothetical protein